MKSSRAFALYRLFRCAKDRGVIATSRASFIDGDDRLVPVAPDAIDAVVTDGVDEDVSELDGRAERSGRDAGEEPAVAPALTLLADPWFAQTQPVEGA
jgi:hypothetical protein